MASNSPSLTTPDTMDIMRGAVIEDTLKYEVNCTSLMKGFPAISLHVSKVVVCILVVLVNSFLFVALLIRRHCHSARSHLFVLNLTVCGLVGGLSNLIFLTIDSFCSLSVFMSHSRILCEMQLLSFVFTYILNVTALGVVALDRYILIVHSLRYMDIMTNRRVIILLTATWAVSGIGSLSILGDNKWEWGVRCEEQSLIPAWHLLAVQLPLSTLILMIVTAIHLRIRHEARRSARLHHQMYNSFGRNGGIDGKRPSEWSKFSAKSAKVISEVVACYLAAFLPIQISLFLDVFSCGTQSERRLAFYVSVPIFTMSFVLNPLLYTLKNSNLRADLNILYNRIMKFGRKALQSSTRTVAHSVRI